MVISGRLVLLQLLGIIPAVIWPTPNVVFGWFAAVVALGIVDAMAAASPKKLLVKRNEPVATRVGQHTESQIVLRNPTSRRLRAVVRDAWTPSAHAADSRHRVALRPGDGARIATGLQPTRRGILESGPVVVRSYGPLGLIGRQRSLPVTSQVRVLPAFHSRRHLPSKLARLRELDGHSAVQIRGEGTEFDSLREYVIGDDVRSIDWRASARRADVVVRTWRPERDRRVLIIVDTGRTSAMRTEDGTRLEAGIEATLLLSALAAHAGDHVEVLAFDSARRAAIHTDTTHDVLATVANGLMSLEPALVETNWEKVAGWVAQHHRQRSLVVLVTGLEPAPLEAGLLPVIGHLTRRHTVILASATAGGGPKAAGGDPATAAPKEALPASSDAFVSNAFVPDAFDTAANARWELDRAGVSAQLQQAGVHVVDRPASDLASALSDRYLDLKSMGEL
ncbi:DUF58 domain-containing protein [Rarobacter incanus]|uniref:Uncharacterized protein (DUF58 family) n=1 Tax=Rarobacter incanus TaxID=153494 RepID=A0A542SNS8_9MICO|nr:DUF58 domain-containing protein [Rarobacter incanus]TQK76205.1 uncharacterized protein (DUF58 family) [Rarobacter incanus]